MPHLLGADSAALDELAAVDATRLRRCRTDEGWYCGVRAPLGTTMSSVSVEVMDSAAETIAFMERSSERITVAAKFPMTM